MASIGIGAKASEPLNSAMPVISVLSCIVGAGPDGRPGLEITFKNSSTNEYTSIIWRVRLAGGWLDFHDNGDSAPEQIAKRVLYWRGGSLTGYYEDRADCSAVAVQTKTGLQWKAPGVDLTPEYSQPTPRPNDATPIPATIDNPNGNPVGIVSCVLDIERGRTRGLGRKAGFGVLMVRFRNLSSHVIDRVIFRAKYLSSGVDFIYGGHFSPGALVSSDQRVFGTRIPGGHLMEELPVSTPVSYASFDDDPGNCGAVSARYEDGTEWQNPSVGATPPPLPTAPPTLPPN
ncbi:MAG: hypothetical protein ACXWNM_13510 [Vulcanimicrobiaceae bacterium]